MLPSMRIAMLSIHSCPLGELGTRDTGGMSVYIRELASKLGQKGHRTDIFTRNADFSHPPVMSLGENVRLVHLNPKNSHTASKTELETHTEEFFGALDQYRRSHGLSYDLVHSHYWISGRVGQIAQNHWNVPHVVMFHTLGAVKNSTGVGAPEPPRRIEAEMDLVANCDRVLAPTATEKERLIKYYRAAVDKIGIVPCGVNLDLFRPTDRNRARQALGFHPHDALVLFVGRFDPLKGLEKLLQAVSYLQHLDHLKLLIIGGDGCDDRESRRLLQLTRTLGIHERVVFAGRVPQEALVPYYAAADLLALPSFYESFGLVGLEALACGTPVVATPVGAMETLLTNNAIGQIVANGSAHSLAQGIETVLAQTPLDRAGQIRSAVRAYSWDKVASAVLDEYLLALNS